MRTSINPMTPGQVYRYALQAFQFILRLRVTKKIAAETMLSVPFAAAARISSSSCRRPRGGPDEHVVAQALHSALAAYKILRRQVQAALP